METQQNLVSLPISKLNGTLDRTCIVETIEYMSLKNREAKIKYIVKLDSLNIEQTKWITVTNENIVNFEGKRITRELTDQTFELPILEEGQPELTPEQVETLKQEHFLQVKSLGTPSFDFWWNVAKNLTLTVALENSITLLDSQGYFN